MIENFLDLVDRTGHVPNGGRVYYSRRSQPPLLTAMVARFVQFSGNLSFLERALPTLEAEYRFWMTERVVNITGTSCGCVAFVGCAFTC